jgi:hypothetical protein
MNYARSKRYLPLLGLLIASSSALPQAAEEPVTAYVDVDQEAVVGFLPPSMQNLRDSGAAQAQDQVRWAVHSVERCLSDDHVHYEVVFAERIVVRSRAGEESFELGRLMPLVGALLLRPDSNGRILFAGGGPEALDRLLRQAAGEYFGKQCDAG